MKPNDGPIPFKDYEDYVRAEWDKFLNEPDRSRAALEAIAGINLRHALDIGCGAGQELLPFVTQNGVRGVGIDISADVGKVGREMYAEREPRALVSFVRASAENLPFPANSFDVVICRLALPYTDNRQAFAEVARVLRPQGRYFLKISGVRWYLLELRKGLLTGNVMSFIHAARVLAAGVLYHLTGRQPRTRIPSSETFQSEWLLRRELNRHGLFIKGKAPDSNRITPSFVIVKETLTSSSGD